MAGERRIDPLTSLRFIAATFVIAYHGKGIFVFFDNMPEYLAYTQPVCFFFLLSGFILSYVYHDFKNFDEITQCWLKRFARIWPLHISIFVLRFFMFPKYLLTFPGAAPKLLVMLSNIFMLHGWVPLFQYFFSYNAPSWSISTEFFFYLVFPFILPLVSKRPYWSLVVSFAINALAIYACNLANLPEINEQGIELRGILYIIPPPRLFEFVLGMVIAKVFLGPAQNFKPSVTLATLIEGFALALTTYLCINTRPIAAQLAQQAWIGPAGGYWFINTGVPLVGFVLTIFIMAINRGLFSRLFSLAPFVFLGEISYSVYLLHHPLLCYHGLYLSQYRDTAALLHFSAILFIASHLMYRWVEAPMRQFIVASGTRVLRHRQKTEPTAKRPARATSKKALAWYGIEAAVLVALIFTATPPLKTMTIEQAEQESQSNEAIVKNVSFDKDIYLLSARRQKNGHRLVAIWKANNTFKAGQFLNIQFLDKDGKLIATQVVRLAQVDKKIEQGTIWQEDIDLMEAHSNEATSLGLIIYESEHNIKVAQKEGLAAMNEEPITIDQESHRLILKWKD
ncbi:MAG: acyltransferase [Candidatus Obscuribacter sp.]|nr:acyltransferase [Candidatus Obscuribacter sp.]